MARRFPSARSLALDVSPLRRSVPFRALWLGQIVSLMGTQMRYVAVPYQIYQLTGSTVAVGMVGLAEVVPLIVFSIAGGTLVDSADRRRVMRIAQVGMMATSVGLALWSLQDEPGIAGIYALTALSSAINSLDRPAWTAMIPSLVGADKVSAATALRQVVFQVTQIVGPGLAGVLLSVVDLWVVYALDTATFVAALIALQWVPSSPPSGQRIEKPLEKMRAGLRFVLRAPVLMSIFVIDLVAMVFGMPRAVFPELAHETFGIGAAGLGLLYAAPSAGALIGALTTGWVHRIRRQGLAVLVAVSAWGLFITLAGLSLFSLVLTLTFLALAGAADVVSAVFRGTMLQHATPDELRGRVSAVNIMVVTGGPRLGDVEAGLAAGVVGAEGSVIVGGLACLAGTGVVAARFPSLKGYQSKLPADRVGT